MFVGVDPGRNGGIAVIGPDSEVLTYRIPQCPAELRDLVDGLRSAKVAVIEQVHSSPQMGIRSAFTFGRGYGGLVQAFVSAGIPVDYVSPQRWQRAIGCVAGGDKGVLKQRAQALFPGIKVTLQNADALLLAEYARSFRWKAARGAAGGGDDAS